MIRLYSYFRSSASYRVRVALELKGLSYTYEPVHLVKDGGEQKAEPFLQINPMGQVPFLIDGEFGISQSMAILNYLDKKYPQPRIFPENVESCAKVIQLCEIVNSGIHPLQNLSVLQKIESEFGATAEDKIEWASDWIGKGFGAFEAELRSCSGKFCVGDELTAADLLLVPQVYNAKRFKLDLAPFPLIAAIEERCLDLDVFKRAEPGAQPDTPAE